MDLCIGRNPANNEWVIGAARSTPNIYTTTFHDSRHSDILPDTFNLSDYTTRIVSKSAREQIAVQNGSPEGRSLHEWYSPGRGDNFITSHSGWNGRPGDERSPDYRYVSSTGFAFSPSRPQPFGTVPLYSWFSPSRGDNFATTQSIWTQSYDPNGGPNRGPTRSPDYTNARLEGFIYPADSPQPPHTMPLYRWYSSERADNFTTTQWSGIPGDTRSPDYRFSRLEGYVLVEDPGRHFYRGDFDRDGSISAVDLDELMRAVAAGSHDTRFDLNVDDYVDDRDRDEWLENAAEHDGYREPYLVGDSNLDGLVDAHDLNALALNWQTATHEWSGGNFTGASVDAADLNALRTQLAGEYRRCSFAGRGAGARFDVAGVCCLRRLSGVRIGRRSIKPGRYECEPLSANRCENICG